MLRKWFKDEEGQGMVEYGLIIGLIAIVVIVALVVSVALNVLALIFLLACVMLFLRGAGIVVKH